jgi:hypothetical protein
MMKPIEPQRPQSLQEGANDYSPLLLAIIAVQRQFSSNTHAFSAPAKDETAAGVLVGQRITRIPLIIRFYSRDSLAAVST